MVKQRDFKQELLTVGTATVTVSNAIPVNSIRGVYGLKLANLASTENRLHMDRLLGSTVTAVDMFLLSAKEVQDWPGHEITEKTLPFWQFEEANCSHIEFKAEAASVSVFIKYTDEHA